MVLVRLSANECRYAVFILLVLDFTLLVSAAHDYTAHDYTNSLRPPKCGPDENLCQFSLTVEHTLSMMASTSDDAAANPAPLIIYPNGSYALRSRTACDKVTFVDKEQVIENAQTLDGTYRIIMTVNGQMPGPAIVVYEGQEVVVNVTNGLLGEAITMHYHGLHQMNTPWMDGTGGVSHCPITPGETFTYRFVAHPVGTFWYHSHQGVQRSEGMFGPLIILPMPGSVRHKAEDDYPTFDDDFHMTVQDFYVQSSIEVYLQYVYQINRLYKDNSYSDLGSCYSGRQNVDGRMNTYIEPRSILINGKGWHFEGNSSEPENPGIPLENYVIETGKKYRFRIINAALALTLRVSIDSHVLNVIATDGFSLKSRKVESVIVGPGERFDFWIEAVDPDNTGSYWIRVDGIEWAYGYGLAGERVRPIRGKAVLSYKGTSSSGGTTGSVIPATQRQACTGNTPCRLLNCLYQSYPQEEHMECVPLTSLEPAMSEHPIATQKDDVIEKFLHFHFGEGRPLSSTINGKQFKAGTSPPQIYPKEPWESPEGLCDFDEPCLEGVCQCTHVLKVPTGSVVQLVLMVMAHEDTKGSSTHPIHLHGHTFQVIKVGYPEYDPETAEVKAQSKDIVCRDGMSSCTDPGWSNESWSHGNLPGVAENVVRKDTVAVPVGGYVVIRFETINPGFWFMHCHMEFHNAQGMALIIQEGDIKQMPPTPDNFKTCGNFHWSDEEFKQKTSFDYQKDTYIADQEGVKRFALFEPSGAGIGQGLIATLSTLLVIAAIVCTVLVFKLRKARLGYMNVPSTDVSYTLSPSSGSD